MEKVVKGLQSIKKMQATVDVLLKEGVVKMLRTKPSETCQWQIDMLYQQKDSSIGFAFGGCAKGEGEYKEFPVHCHPESREYLICLQGRVVVNFIGLGIRILNPGDCCEIPNNTAHSTKPLENNVKLLAVCVPYDKGFPESLGRERTCDATK